MSPDSTAATIVGVLLCACILAAFSLQRRWLRTTWVKGMAAYQRGDTVEVLKAFRYLVKKQPGWADARRMLARALAATGAMEEAEKELRFAIQLEPRNSDMHVDLAIFLTSTAPQRHEEALQLLEEAVEHAPNLRMTLATLPQLASLRSNPRFCVLAGLPEPVITPARLN